MAVILDGAELANSLEEQLASETERFTRKTGVVPGLAIIRAGEDAASSVYVRNKVRVAKRVGINAEAMPPLPAHTTQSELELAVRDYNARADIHGIIVQLPVTKGLDAQAGIDLIPVEKDVDGLTSSSVGLYAQGRSLHVPATARAVMTMLDSYHIPVARRNVVVIGRSDLVGKPLLHQFMQRNATVTACHSYTENLADETRRADIIVAAAGHKDDYLLTPDMVKKGATVIDVGAIRVADPTRKSGFRLRGDVHPDVALVAGDLSLPKGGVGPLTVVSLIQNTLYAAQFQTGYRAK